MNIQKILVDGRKLGLSESDIERITTLSEQLNSQKTQLNDQPSKKYEPRDLLNQKVEDKTFRSKGDLLRDKTKTKKNIKSTRESIKDAEEEKRKAFWILGTKERRTATKATKKKIKDGKQQIVEYEHHIKDIDLTLDNIKKRAEEAVTKTQEELQAIATSIQTQLATQKDLLTLAKMMKKIDLNDKKYAPLIAFYNANANSKPSLDNPLPQVPAEVKGLITEFKMEKTKRVIKLTTDTAIRYYTVGNETARRVLKTARDSMLKTSPQPKLSSGMER